MRISTSYINSHFHHQYWANQTVINKLFFAAILLKSETRFENDVGVVEKHGRLSELCIPIHERYNVAVTKVMGSNMNAIVCETAEVARAAIWYLKDHRHQPETFLPLDYIHTASIDDKVRYSRSICIDLS